ncbi:hypothetical protein F4804DRAFT_335790 [Jackrogersella minutella]|nr:hypothetical protein F4804DRAFT_335790 [Jackrogersella minutella]
MSHRFTSESLRKKMKAVKARFSSKEPKRPLIRLQQWNSHDSTIESLGLDATKSVVESLTGKRVVVPISTSSNGSTNGHASMRVDGHRKGQTAAARIPRTYHSDEGIDIRRYDVASRERNEEENNSPATEAPKSSNTSKGGISSEASVGSQEAANFGNPEVANEPESETQDSEVENQASVVTNSIRASLTGSATTGDSFVDPRTVLRTWTDTELNLQCEVIEKYVAGTKLWTREGMLAIENNIKSKNPVVLSAYVGEDEKFEKQKGVTYKVEFHGYRNLSFPPPSRPDGMAYCPMSLKTRPFDYTESRNLDVELGIFQRCTALWLSNPIGQQFYAMFMRVPLPPYINKIVCFDLGNIISKPATDFPQTRQAIFRHVAAMTIIECLHKRFGSMIQLFTQDTSYSSECAKVLFKKGFSVVGQHGAAGFAEIDNRTLVFAPNASFCVKEIVADISEPAAMFWNAVLTPEETETVTRSSRALELDDSLTSFYYDHEPDPDTPRVRELIKSYDKHTFPITNLFGEVALYTRTSLSVSHLPGGSPDRETPIWQYDRISRGLQHTQALAAYKSMGYSF